MQGSLQSSALPAELSKESQGPALHHTLHAPICIIPTDITHHNNALPPIPYPNTLTSNTTTPSTGLHTLWSILASPETQRNLLEHSFCSQKHRTHISKILLSIPIMLHSLLTSAQAPHHHSSTHLPPQHSQNNQKNPAQHPHLLFLKLRTPWC